VSDADRQRLYREASVLVLPSFDEGFGLPALEAMTVGLPVIVSRRGSLPEVVADAGLFVEPEDTDSLAMAMAQVLSDPALRARLSEAGRRRAADFTWPASAHRLYEAYRSAIARRRPS
jgi:alpha-1,3-rhamnosyl/mannosyltransferase